LKTLHILTIDRADGAPLQRELMDAARGLRGYVVVGSSALDLPRGVEIAKDRRPDVILVPAISDLEELRTFASRLRGAGLTPLLVGIYDREQLTGDGKALLAALRADVRDFVQRPLSSGELQEVLDRHASLREARRGSEGPVVAFVSNKGGIGKSTLAVSLACVLARKYPDRVLLIDASLQLGVAASMLDLLPDASLADAAREKERLDETLLVQLTARHPCGLRLLAAPVDAVEATQIDDRALGRVLTVARAAFDYVIVDTFPQLDSIAVTVLDQSDRLYVVTGGAVPHVIGTVKLLSVLERMAIPHDRQRIVLNETHPSFSGRLSPREVAARLERDLEHVFPFDKSLLVALNTGKPYALRASRLFGFGKALAGLLADVERSAALAAAGDRS